MSNTILYRDALYRKVAYLYPEVAQFKAYLEMSDSDKAMELARFSPDLFRGWLAKSGEVDLAAQIGDEEPEEDIDALYGSGAVTQQLLESFLMYGQYKVVGDSDAPSWLFFSSPSLVKNQWLIHFTDRGNLAAIENHGFQKGEDDYTKLGLTVWRRHSGPGFNFAFTLDDYLRYAPSRRGSDRDWKYGNACVMFRASGVKVYHNGDEEYQVVFWGPSARDIVGLYQIDGNWTPDPCRFSNAKLPGFENLNDLTDWVVNNHSQYRKVLSCR